MSPELPRSAPLPHRPLRAAEMTFTTRNTFPHRSLSQTSHICAEVQSPPCLGLRPSRLYQNEVIQHRLLSHLHPQHRILSLPTRSSYVPPVVQERQKLRFTATLPTTSLCSAFTLFQLLFCSSLAYAKLFCMRVRNRLLQQTISYKYFAAKLLIESSVYRRVLVC